MEVHRHNHRPVTKWTHYLWEFLMLFLAVFCGFMAENLREHSIEKKYLYATFSHVETQGMKRLQSATALIALIKREYHL